MSYRDELKEKYTNPEYPSRNMNEWLNIIESGELSHAMVMGLVAERDALRADLQGANNFNEYLNRQNIDIAKEIGALRAELQQAREEIERLRAENTFLSGKTPGDLALSAIGSFMQVKSAPDLADVLTKDNERLRAELEAATNRAIEYAGEIGRLGAELEQTQSH